MAFKVIRKVSSRGEIREKILDVPADVLRIGRGAFNELCLDDLAVSLSHAEIRRNEQGSYAVRDVSQGQIIYLNRAPVKEAVLQPGDVLKIQNYSLSISRFEPSGLLVLSIEEGAATPIEPSLALMPRLQLSGSRWTKWRLAVVVLVVLAAGSVLGGVFSQGTMLMPGAVSVKHSKFAAQCEVCHTSAKPVWSFVDSAACQTCHRSEVLPPSHFNQDVALSPSPVCASCHLEHKGHQALADVSDGRCVQCHGDLKAKDQTVPAILAVHNFTNGHPEFAITRAQPGTGIPFRVRLNDKEQLKDDGRLKLNHALHLKLEPDYLESTGRKPLICTDCHRVDDEGRYMQPISFQRDCVQCHSGDIDLAPALPGRRVTHGRQLDLVRQQLDEIFSASYLQAHPEEAQKPEQLRWIPGRRLPGQPQTPQERYVVDRRVEGEKILLSSKVKKCLKCHVVEEVDPGAVTATRDEEKTVSSREANVSKAMPVPTRDTAPVASTLSGTQQEGAKLRIARVSVPVRWLPYNRFDHRAHAAIPEIKSKGEGNWCVPCHENAVISLTSDDVLLPSISLCRTCHFEPGGAQASCKSCHDFHVPQSPGIPSLATFHSRSIRQLSFRWEGRSYA